MSAVSTIPADPYPWPRRGSLDPRRLALLCIDWQADFCVEGGFIASLGYDISLARSAIGPTVRLLGRARELGLAVIHTREGHRSDLSDLPANKRRHSRAVGSEIGTVGPLGRFLVRGERGWDIIPELSPRTGEVVIDKPGKGAFHATDLEHILRATGVTDLIVTGLTTDVCVEATVREAMDRGFDCLVVTDCTAATATDRYEYALITMTQQGGLFAAAIDSDALLAALSTVETDTAHGRAGRDVRRS